MNTPSPSAGRKKRTALPEAELSANGSVTSPVTNSKGSPSSVKAAEFKKSPSDTNRSRSASKSLPRASVPRRTSSGLEAPKSPTLKMDNTTPLKNASNSSLASNGAAESSASVVQEDEELSRMSREQLVALIARERTTLEELHGKLTSTTSEHASITVKYKDLSRQHVLLDSRLQEAHSATSRFEKELSDQMDKADALELQIRTAEKENRDLKKSHRSQTEAIGIERKSWAETEQSLQEKLSKTQRDYDDLLARFQSHTEPPSDERDPFSVPSGTKQSLTLDPSLVAKSPSSASIHSPVFAIPAATLDELHSLHMQVEQLNEEQVKSSSEVQRLQAQIDELRNLNKDLQEENENYEVLLSEKILAGLSSMVAPQINRYTKDKIDTASEGSRSVPASSLDPLEEEQFDDDRQSVEYDDGKDEFERSPEYLEASGDGTAANGAIGAQSTPEKVRRPARKRDGSMNLGQPMSLGAELNKAREKEAEQSEAAELRNRGRATNAVRSIEDSSNPSAGGGREGEPLTWDLESLRNEVKLLRQENKGLSTYVGRILEKVIGLEGFEKVLAVDRDHKSHLTTASSRPRPPDHGPITPSKSGLASISYVTSSETPQSKQPSSAIESVSGPPPPFSNSGSAKKNRMSMDWITSALWKSSSDKPPSTPAPRPVSTVPGPPAVDPPPGLKPMMLNAASTISKSPVIEEDEEDQIARARLESEMKLMGIANHGSPVLHHRSRSISQRLSADLSSSPNDPPLLPPKDDSIGTHSGKHSDNQARRKSAQLETPTATSAEGGVKVRGHRKRPSAGNRDSMLVLPHKGATSGSSPSSIGLGLSYSKDSTASSWSAESPRLGTFAEDKDLRDLCNRPSSQLSYTSG